MLYYEMTIGNESYKLRLNTRNIVELEKKIGCNPISIFTNANGTNRVPTVYEMVAVLHASLQQMQHGITFDNAYDLFDKYTQENGKSATGFIGEIYEIYKVSGLIPNEETTEEETEKN